MAGKPNILAILSDQHAPQFSGPYGHPIVRTPHMDALAAEGVVFENAYCNSPICVLSRMAFMTGLHLRNSEIWDSGVPLRQDAVRIPLIISGRHLLPAGLRISEVVSTVDVTATLLDLAGVEPLSPLDGDSLLPLTRGAPGWKDEALSGFYADGASRPWAMLRQRKHKLIYSYGEPLELYDLENDPGELHNLADNPDYQDVREALTTSLLSRWNPPRLIAKSARARRNAA